VLDGAIRLFVDRGPASVSLRDIADEANVNLGLLHRHFGSKSELISAAVTQLVEDFGPSIADVFASPEMPDELTQLVTAPPEAYRAYARMLAWLLLDGTESATLEESHPAIARLVQRLGSDGLDDEDARCVGAAVAAFALGWLLYAPFLRAAAQLDDVPPEHVRKVLAAALERVIDAGADD
jgi:TetR/AcrR family transcriptional regulator, repressor for neighboring sulfatase